MGTLDQIMDLQKKGVSEKDILRHLKEQGISPKEINDALGQAKIKSSVSAQGNENMQRSIMASGDRDENQIDQDLPTEGSISDEDLTPLPQGMPPIMQQMARVPLHREDNEEDYVPGPGEYESQQYPQNQYQYQSSSQEYQPQEGNYQNGTMVSGDTDTIIEISEQVFAERMKGAVKQIELFNEFKTLTQAKVENISERLKRIESTIDMLQISILEKVGVYGRGIESIRKEMDMMQDSFGKVVNSAVSRPNNSPQTESKPREYYSEEKTIERQNQAPTLQRIEKKTTVLHKSSKPVKKVSKR